MTDTNTMSQLKRAIAREWLFFVFLCLCMLAIYSLLLIIYGGPSEKERSFFDSISREPYIDELRKPYMEALMQYEKNLISWEEFQEIRENLRIKHTQVPLPRKIWNIYHDNLLLIIAILYAALQFIRSTSWSIKTIRQKPGPGQ